MVQRTAVDPVSWATDFGFAQGVLVTGAVRTLHVSGQTAMSASGAPEHEGDMGRQLSLALDNLEAVLAAAGMGLANVVRVGLFTTDVDRLLAEYGVLASRLGAAGVRPTMTLVGVARLSIPGQLVEVEATAVD